MKKEELIDKIKNDLASISGTFEEYSQFACDELFAILPFINRDGLTYLKNQITDVKKLNGID